MKKTTLVLLGFLLGCGPTQDDLDPVVAQVGDEWIRASELEAFAEDIPDGMKQGGTPLRVHRNLLESLIDKKLLLAEARATDTENDPWFIHKMEQKEKDLLIRLYRVKHAEKFLIDQEEAEKIYRKSRWDRALRLGMILFENKEQALQTIADLEAGADFAQLARERSLDEESRERGGDGGTYLRRDQIEPIADRIFHLSVGEISAPLPKLHNQEKRHAVLKILDEIPVPFEVAAPAVHKALITRKKEQQLKTVIDSLKASYALRIHHEAIQLLIRLNQDSATDIFELPEPEASRPLCTYKGGQITLDDLLQDARALQLGRPALNDSLIVLGLLNETVIARHLFLAEARVQGLDQDPGLLETLARAKEEFLLDALRRREVDQHVEASEEEMREFYEAHPEKFTDPETTIIAEILVKTDSLAWRLKTALEQGADAAQLAREHSRRTGLAHHHDGEIRLNLYTKGFFPDVYQAVQQLEVGDIGGPVKVREGYSVFKLLDRVARKNPYDKESRRRARAYVRIDKSKRDYVSYVRGLRDKYPVAIFDEKLEMVIRTAAPSG